jgi:hypothetical protein
MERALFLFTLSAFALSLALLILFPMGSFTGIISTLFYNTAVSFYGILLLIIWFCVDSGIGTGFKIGAGMGCLSGRDCGCNEINVIAYSSAIFGAIDFNHVPIFD